MAAGPRPVLAEGGPAQRSGGVAGGLQRHSLGRTGYLRLVKFWNKSVSHILLWTLVFFGRAEQLTALVLAAKCIFYDLRRGMHQVLTVLSQVWHGWTNWSITVAGRARELQCARRVARPAY